MYEYLGTLCEEGHVIKWKRWSCTEERVSCPVLTFVLLCICEFSGHCNWISSLCKQQHFLFVVDFWKFFGGFTRAFQDCKKEGSLYILNSFNCHILPLSYPVLSCFFHTCLFNIFPFILLTREESEENQYPTVCCDKSGISISVISSRRRKKTPYNSGNIYWLIVFECICKFNFYLLHTFCTFKKYALFLA